MTGFALVFGMLQVGGVLLLLAALRVGARADAAPEPGCAPGSERRPPRRMRELQLA